MIEKICLDQQRKLRLKVFYKNPQAIGFYSKIGFVKVGVEETDIGKGYVIIDDVMEKSLIS